MTLALTIAASFAAGFAVCAALVVYLILNSRDDADHSFIGGRE